MGGRTSMSYTLAQAAAAIGRNRSSVLRAIKAGKISAVRDPVSAEWRIEPAELHRLYPAAPTPGEAPRNTVRPTGHQIERPTGQNSSAQVEIRELRAQLADARELVDTLWRRLDRADEERRQVQARLDAILTHQRPPPAPPRRAWWPWSRRT